MILRKKQRTAATKQRSHESAARAACRGCSAKTLALLVAVVGLCFLCALLFSPQVAHADTMDELESEIDDGLGNIDFSDLEEVSSPFFESFAEKVRQIINGEYDSAAGFLELISSMFGSNLTAILPQLISIFCVMIICGLARKTSQGFISEDTEKVISFVGLTVVIISVLSLVVEAYKQVSEMLTRVSVLTDAAMPVLLTLVIANGGNAVSSVCQPSMVMFSSVVINAVHKVIFPLSVFGMAFVLVSNISDNVRVSKMSHFLNSASSWILGVLFMVFSAFTTVQGISAAAIDGVSYRAAKFAAKNYIPILGGYVSDGFDIIVASTSLIKNAFGVVAMLLVFFITLQPLITLACVNLGLQAVAAVSEPVVDEKYVKMLSGISKCLNFLAALVIAVAFMFCILALVAICSANVL